MLQIKVNEVNPSRRVVPIHMVSNVDGLTALTGQTGTAELLKNGGLPVATQNNVNEVSASLIPGYYTVTLAQSECDTYGVTIVRYKSSQSAEYQIAFQIVGLDPYQAQTTAGAGAIGWQWVEFKQDGATPLPGVSIWVTSDPAGLNVVAGTVITDVNGSAVVYLTSGQTYYLWRALPGWTFTNPTIIGPVG